MVFSLWIFTIYLHFIVVGIYSNLFFRNTRQFYYNLNFLVCCRYLRQRLSLRQNCRSRLTSSSTLSIFWQYTSGIKINNSVRYSRKGSIINPENSGIQVCIWIYNSLITSRVSSISLYGIGRVISVKCCLYNVEYQTLFIGPFGYNFQNALLYWF